MPEYNNRGLLTALVIIGIIIIILLMSPRLQSARTYSYTGYNNLSASAVRVPMPRYQTVDSDYYTFVRHIPIRRAYQNTTYTTYSYPSGYTSSTYTGEPVFSDGCTLTSPYSTTTGEPCS